MAYGVSNGAVNGDVTWTFGWIYLEKR